MIPTISIRNLHLEYRLWVNELIFYKDEIKAFEHQLEDSINKKALDELTPLVEQFQNRFILQKDVIDQLKHDLSTSESQLASFALELSAAGHEDINMDNHAMLRERMSTFRKLYTELKADFRQFVVEWF